MAKKQIVIIHFSPLELYPPVQNIIRVLKETTQSQPVNINVFTTTSVLKNVGSYSIEGSNIKIYRLGKSGKQLIPIIRYWNYFKFNFLATLLIILKKPVSVLYVETISAFPAWFCKAKLTLKFKLLIHYHEYTTVDEYKAGMKLVNFFHKQEKNIFKESSWLSHTNQERMQKFQHDIFPITIPHPQVLPNYPPGSWKRIPPEKNNVPLKILYTGAVSLDTMYLREFAEWVLSQNGMVTWDIYSLMITDEAKQYLASLSPELINLKPAIAYEYLPQMSAKYDAGVILYKGHQPNYVYNAPNKLFEYLAVGLDVWFPNEVLGILEYKRTDKYPVVYGIDFLKLDEFTLKSLPKRESLCYGESDFFCEDALKPLINELLSD